MMHPKHISTYILAAATSMLSLFAVLPCQAQSKKKIIEQQPDTIPFFRGMAVGVDLIGPVQLMVSDYGQYEASLRINLKTSIILFSNWVMERQMPAMRQPKSPTRPALPISD